jgi:hypothetical protein
MSADSTMVEPVLQTLTTPIDKPSQPDRDFYKMPPMEEKSGGCEFVPLGLCVVIALVIILIFLFFSYRNNCKKLYYDSPYPGIGCSCGRGLQCTCYKRYCY